MCVYVRGFLDLRIEARNKFAAEKKRKMRVDHTKVQPKTSSRANPDSTRMAKTKKRLDDQQRPTIPEQSIEDSYSNSNSHSHSNDVEMEPEDQK